MSDVYHASNTLRPWRNRPVAAPTPPIAGPPPPIPRTRAGPPGAPPDQ